jgi:hypothetical protein
LDHFRAFAAAWHVPMGAASARLGQWVPGPGSDFFLAAQSELGHLPLIAEDLGLITPDVIQLRDSQKLPGMRVLQFAFDGNPQNPHLPHNYGHNTVAYTGTHDNNTTRGWFESLPEPQRQAVWAYLRRAPVQSRDSAPELMRLAWSSPAALAIAPVQDLLDLGGELSIPGQASGNWRCESLTMCFAGCIRESAGGLDFMVETAAIRPISLRWNARTPRNRGDNDESDTKLHNLGQSICRQLYLPRPRNRWSMHWRPSLRMKVPDFVKSERALKGSGSSPRAPRPRNRSSSLERGGSR